MRELGTATSNVDDSDYDDDTTTTVVQSQSESGNVEECDESSSDEEFDEWNYEYERRRMARMSQHPQRSTPVPSANKVCVQADFDSDEYYLVDTGAEATSQRHTQGIHGSLSRQSRILCANNSVSNAQVYTDLHTILPRTTWDGKCILPLKIIHDEVHVNSTFIESVLAGASLIGKDSYLLLTNDENAKYRSGVYSNIKIVPNKDTTIVPVELRKNSWYVKALSPASVAHCRKESAKSAGASTHK